MGQAVAVAMLIAGLVACNDTPVEGLEKSFTLKVRTDSGTSDPVKIDFLWVVDNSTSMCEEQVALTESFGQFRTTLERFFQIDPQIAVTTHDVQCETNATNIGAARGLFNGTVTTAFPAPCQQRAVYRCTSDSACDQMDCAASGACRVSDDGYDTLVDPISSSNDDGIDTCTPCLARTDLGEWECREAQSATCLENPNGTVNSSCRRRCESDAECQSAFNDDLAFCLMPSTNRADWGCIRPPRTAGCPADLPPVLTGDNIDNFGCLATVGVNQEKCFKYEQGMNAALMALDTNGPNKDQALGFLRDDAYLVIIFVTDEDDCSAVGEIGEQDYEKCALLETTDTGGPLIPVGHFVNRFKSIKNDPGRVIVAAIAGDSVFGSPADQQADREAFTTSKGDNRTCYQQSFICNSPSGKADYGARYAELTDSFGSFGTFTNICDNAGIGQALDQIAGRIILVLNKLCLPKPILASLVVRRTNPDGSVDVLIEGEGQGTFAVVPGGDECAVDDQQLPALIFGDNPVPGEEIDVEYQGDPQFQ